MGTRETLVHVVTAYDRKQAALAAGNPRRHHNVYALSQYLARCEDIMSDIGAGADIEQAIIAGFTPGSLRTACLKAFGYSASTIERSGNYKGMPVYKPASEN